MYRRKIELILTDAVKRAFPDRDVSGFFPVTLDICANEMWGDYFSTIAIIMANEWGVKPDETAGAIVGAVERIPPFCKSITHTVNGFINIALANDAIYYGVMAILLKDQELAPYCFGLGQKASVVLGTTSSLISCSADDARVLAVGAFLENVLKVAGYVTSIEMMEKGDGERLWLIASAVEHRYRELLGDGSSGQTFGIRGKSIVGVAKGIIERFGADFMFADRPGRISVIKDQIPQIVASALKLMLSELGVVVRKTVKSSSFEGRKGLFEELSRLFKSKDLLYEEEVVPFNHWICSRKEDFRPGRIPEGKRFRRVVFESILKMYPFWESPDRIGEDGKPRVFGVSDDALRVVYPCGRQVWLRSSAFGDISDRLLFLPNGEPSDYFGDLCMIVSRLREKSDLVILMKPADEAVDFYSRYACVLKFLGYDEKCLRVVASERVTLKNYPKPKETQRGENAGFVEVLASLPKEDYWIANLVKGPQEPLVIDCRTAGEFRNSFLQVQQRVETLLSEYSRKTSMLDFKKMTVKDLMILRDEREIRLIKNIIIFPSIVCDVAENFNVGILYRYVSTLMECFDDFYSSGRVFCEDKSEMSAKAAMVQAFKRIFMGLRHVFSGTSPAGKAKGGGR